MLDNTTHVTLSWYEHRAFVQRQADKSSLLFKVPVGVYMSFQNVV